MFKGLMFFVKFGWKTDKRYIIYLVLKQFIGALIPIVAVVMPKYIIGELMAQGRISYLLAYAAILVGYTFVGGAIANWLSWNVFTLRVKLANEFYIMLYRKMADADLEKLENPEFLDLKARAEKFLSGDWRGFSYLLESAVNSFGNILTVTGMIAVISTLNVYIVLLFIALVLIQSSVDGWAKKNFIKTAFKRVNVEREWMYYGNIFQDFAYGKEIRMYGLRDWLLEREAEFGNRAVETYRESNSFQIKAGTIRHFADLIQQSVTYGYLISKVLASAISIGDFTMFAGAVAVFSNAMKGVVDNLVDVWQYGIYYDAVEDYLNIPCQLRGGKGAIVSNESHRIEFRNVSFKYAGQSKYALKNINIVINSGEKLSVVGENGAGKTTFIKLLCRIYVPTDGTILLDGIDISTIDYEAYMALISAVFQDYKLFSFSLKDNIALALSDRTTDAEIESTLKKVGLDSMLKGLQGGVRTQVYKNFDADGFEPSGGEGQRIALARALFKNSPIVILDEPTAALDPRAEYEIYQHFEELVRGKTAIFVSHRLSSTRFCDHIAVFHDGEVVEYGTHDALMESKALYAELYSMQAKFYTNKTS